MRVARGIVSGGWLFRTQKEPKIIPLGGAGISFVNQYVDPVGPFFNSQITILGGVKAPKES